MNKIYAKIAATAASVVLLGGMFVPSVFASENKGSKVTIISTTLCDVDQSSTTNTGTVVLSAALTGGNKAYKNVGKKGGVTVTSGNASSTVGVAVAGGNNTATNPCCGCQPAAPSGLSLNNDGPKSGGSVTVVTFNGTFIDQSSTTNTFTGVGSVAATGGNSASNNVGGPVSVTSGNATSTVSVVVTGGSNTIK